MAVVNTGKTFMKLQCIFIFLCASFGYVEAQKMTKVNLSIMDCRVNEAYPGYRSDTVQFFKLPEDTIAFRVIPGQQKKFPMVLNDVPVSEYRIQFTNMYNEKVSIIYTIRDQVENNIYLCMTRFSLIQITLY